MGGGKRVRIQSAHGILIPGGLANTPRGRATTTMLWRSSKMQTAAYVAAALVLYAVFATARNLLRDDHGRGPGGGAIAMPDIPLDFNSVAAASGLPFHDDGPDADDDDGAAVADQGNCPEYGRYASSPHEPRTGGAWNLPYQRPEKRCRKVVVEEVEETLREMNALVKDPDLFRLFENCFPNTLDTSVTWTGVADDKPNEELTFITTGDIHAMWLRDSANQLQSYVSLLKPQPPSRTAAAAKTAEDSPSPPPTNKPSRLASLFRGAINLQARYLLASPHCNAFQPPPEAALAAGGDGNPRDAVWPHYDTTVVFECKYELDSLAAFLQLSWDYYSRTKDARFFLTASLPPPAGGLPPAAVPTTGWKAAVVRLLDTAEAMRMPTYTPAGMVQSSPYRFERQSSVSTETLPNHGNGSPVRAGTGLMRSAFRPSDDATTYQLLVPANMMMAKYLDLCAEIMVQVENEEARAAAASAGATDRAESADEEDEELVSERMTRLAKDIKKGVDQFAKVKHPDFGEILAYETDGFFSHNVMDDANLPSLLSAPLTSYLPRTDPLYRATRKFILSEANPYYGHGPVLNGTGGPHIGPGMVWPMSLIVGIMTSDDDAEIRDLLRQLLSSTDSLGLMHESVNVHNQGLWTRPWFSWANGLFGQMMLDLKARKPHILKLTFQPEPTKQD